MVITDFLAIEKHLKLPQDTSDSAPPNTQGSILGSLCGKTIRKLFIAAESASIMLFIKESPLPNYQMGSSTEPEQTP